MKQVMGKMMVFIAGVLMLTTGCNTVKNANNKQKGAVIGAGSGAVIGGVIGNNVGKGNNTALGAIIGAAVGGVAGGAGDEHAGGFAGSRVGCTQFRLGGVEDGVPAAELDRQVDDRNDHCQVNQKILHNGDQGRSPQARRIGVSGQDHERDDQRQVRQQNVLRTAQSQHSEHSLDADQLQRDVRHGRDDAGDGDGKGQGPAAIAAANEVGRRDEPMSMRDGPQPAHQEEYDWVQNDCVRHREEAGHGPGGPHRSGNGHKGIGRIQVTPEKEPGHPGPKPAAAEAPLIEAVQPRFLAPAPPRGNKPQNGHQDEKKNHNSECHDVNGPVRSGQGKGHPAHRSSPGLVRPRTDSRLRRSSLITSQ